MPKNCQRVVVRNVKLCNSRVQNDDGINPCNSQDVLITDCFIRSDDDCIAFKGLDFSGRNSNVEQIMVENCILWCDRARIFLLGHESRAEFMRNITLRNLDIIHFTMTPFLLEPGEDMRLQDIMIEDMQNKPNFQKVTDYTTLGTTHQFARAYGTPDYAHNNTIDFGGVPAKYVRLTANSNWGGIIDQYGLSEVRFFAYP